MIACPPDETLRDLLRGDLPPDSAEAIRGHVEACDSCLDVLDRLSDDPDLELWMAAGLGLVDDGPVRRAALEGVRAGRPAAGRAFVPKALGPYDIEAEIGRGGMGIVYRARDRTLGRVVALKALRPDVDDDRARRRFVREVRAAAAIEHDHIVRVYATSDPSDPVLYFAMEFIAGPSLAERIEAGGRLDPREAAELVAQAAEGLAAAHAAGLVHRDVKPDNILIESATGRAKVGDFGLARLAAESSDLTKSGVVAGTPAYLSPEQARGDPDTGPAADVYGLGATLYECLTGEPPFRGTPHMVVQQILNDEPRPPRRLNDAVPRDLETICLAAMAKEPHRRYASAAAMADDLRRWQRGEPIHARHTGPVGRAWRLARRRPLAASLIAALGLVMVVGTAAVVLLWRRAEANLSDSERNFRQARDAVDKFYVKVYSGGLLSNPGLETVRLEVVRDAIAYYRDFLRQHGDDPALRVGAAQASYRAGRMLHDVGDRRDAIEMLGQAWPLLEKVAGERPGDLTLRRDAAQCHNLIATLYTALGRFPEAQASHRRAVAAYRALAATEPGNPLWRRLVGHALGNLANTYFTQGQTAEARRTYEEARDQFQALLRLAPDDLGYKRDLAQTLNNLAYVAEPSARTEMLRESLSLREALAAAAPDDLYARRNVARTRTNIAKFLIEPERQDEALRLLDEACAALREVVRATPAQLDYRGDLADACYDRAVILLGLGRPAEALASATEAVDLLVENVRIDPETVKFRSYLANAHDAAAAAHEALGRLADALRSRRARLPLIERLARDRPDDAKALAPVDDERKKIDALLARIGPAAGVKDRK